MEVLAEVDRDLFFYLNGLHASWLDPVMFYISKTFTWLPLYLVMLYLLIREYKWHALLWMAGIALAILFSDQLTSGLMKPMFERLRPSRDPAFEGGLVHIVNGYRGGRFGFASSHAANAFAVTTFLYLVLQKHVRRMGLIFIVAVLIAYSRVYLGVHYPGDVVIGGLIGMIMAWICYLLASGFRGKFLLDASAQRE